MKYQSLLFWKNKNNIVSLSSAFGNGVIENFFFFVFFFFFVEVLRPSQPMSSAVSLPDHTFTGQA